MLPHEFVYDMCWKMLCNAEAEARMRHDAAVARGDVEAAAREAESWRLASEAIKEREQYLLTVPKA